MSESHSERPVQVASSLADKLPLSKLLPDAKQAKRKVPERGGGRKKRGRR